MSVGGEDGANVEYVVVEDAGGGVAAGGASNSDMSGLDSSIANALISSGGKAGQQFQIVKEDADGNQVTTTVVLVPDPSSATGNDLIAMAIDDTVDNTVNTAPTYEEDVDEDGISGIIAGQGPVFITTEGGAGGQDVFQPVSDTTGHYIIQEIQDDMAGGQADPDYVVINEEAEDPEDDDEEDKEEELTGRKREKVEKKLKDAEARFLKRKRAMIGQTRILEYKYLSGQRELDKQERRIHNINVEIKHVLERKAAVEEAIKRGQVSQSEGGLMMKYEVVGTSVGT